MIIDLVKLEKLAEEMEGYPGLHFEYWLSEAGGSGWIQLLPGNTLGSRPQIFRKSCRTS